MQDPDVKQSSGITERPLFLDSDQIYSSCCLLKKSITRQNTDFKMLLLTMWSLATVTNNRPLNAVIDQSESSIQMSRVVILNNDRS